jgi:hypothetical protein
MCSKGSSDNDRGIQLTFHIKEARHCLTLGVHTLYNYLIMTRKISTPPFLLQIMILVVVRFFDEPTES